MSPDMALRLSRVLGVVPKAGLPCRTVTISDRPGSDSLFQQPPSAAESMPGALGLGIWRIG